MKYEIRSLYGQATRTAALLLFACALYGCAELDQLTKPGVEGLQKSSGFSAKALTEGGIGESHIETSLNKKNKANINALEATLVAALRQKRKDLSIAPGGRYEIVATLLANDTSKRSDNFDSHVYRWAKRRVRVNYAVSDTTTSETVWTGIIETSLEELSSYEVESRDNTGKVVDAVVAAISQQELYPYPSPPLFNDVAKLNFEGFALNLPLEK